MSINKLEVGDFTVYALPDGAANLAAWPVPIEVQSDDPVAWASYAERFPEGFHGPEHKWRIHNNCYLVKTGSALVLVDCGVGVGLYPWYGNSRRSGGKASRTGFAPSEVTHVFLTHAHPDHVGWTYDEEACRPRFSNARYLLHERDWKEFSSRSPVPKHFLRFVGPLRDAGVLDCLSGPAEIVPGFDAMETPGHTPGHMSALIRSGSEGLVIAGDVLNSPVFVSEPERAFGSDVDLRAAIATRVALVDRVEAEGWRLAAQHFPAPGWGDVARIEGKRWFRAL